MANVYLYELSWHTNRVSRAPPELEVPLAALQERSKSISISGDMNREKKIDVVYGH